MKNTGLAIAYERGRDAFKEGVFTSPYDDQTIKHKEWQRGFDDAFSENQGLQNVQRILKIQPQSV